MEKGTLVPTKDLPVHKVDVGLGETKVVWKVAPTPLEADHNLLTFADMLREKDSARRALAAEGMCDVIELCPPDRVLAVLPTIIPPLRGVCPDPPSPPLSPVVFDFALMCGHFFGEWLCVPPARVCVC